MLVQVTVVVLACIVASAVAISLAWLTLALFKRVLRRSGERQDS